MKFSTLYKKTSTGAIQQWKIWTLGNIRFTQWGQIDGALQVSDDVITEGKNIGKANETTPTQQAEAEAQSQWEKKLKKGYVQILKDAQAGIVDAVIEGGVFPMLAKKYSEQAEKIKWPAYAQPKLDGHRCLAVIKDGKCTLWSRTRKPITSSPHIIKALEDVFAGELKGVDFMILDGELYNHDYKSKFEELTHLIRQETPTEGYENIQYHIYDIAACKNTIGFAGRYQSIGTMFTCVKDKNADFLKMVKTKPVTDEEALIEFFESCLDQGYEGCMVRNADSLYVNKRSNDLQKVKEFDDGEFRIIGIEEGRGKLAGCGIFRCELDNGEEFSVKMKGDTENLRGYFNKPKSVIGKILTVQFQGLTKTGKPRFPIGLRLRKDI